MKIVIIGGTERIGSTVVAGLRNRGHGAVSASPDRGRRPSCGSRLVSTLSRASALVDVSSSPSLGEGRDGLLDDVDVQPIRVRCRRWSETRRRAVGRGIRADIRVSVRPCEERSGDGRRGRKAQLGQIGFREWLNRLASTA